MRLSFEQSSLAPLTAAPTIDWSRSAQSVFTDESDALKKDKSRQAKNGWLAEFLGLKSAVKQDLAEQTGLKITFDRGGRAPRD
jgi:hypothetical protein